MTTSRGAGLVGEIEFRHHGQIEVTLVGQIQLGHQIRIPVRRRHRRLHIKSGERRLVIPEDDIGGSTGAILLPAHFRLVEIRHAMEGLVIRDAHRHQLIKLAVLVSHDHGGRLGEALLLLFQLAAGTSTQPERDQGKHQEYRQQDDHGEIERRREQLHQPALFGHRRHHGRRRIGLEFRHLFLQGGLILQLGLEGLHLFGQGLQAQLEPVVHLGDLAELGVGIFQGQRHLGRGFAHRSGGQGRRRRAGGAARSSAHHHGGGDSRLGGLLHLGGWSRCLGCRRDRRRLGRCILGHHSRLGRSRLAHHRLGDVGLLVGQVFGAQPLPARVVAVEATACFGIRDAPRLCGGGQQDVGTHQNMVDVAVCEASGVLVIDGHHGLVDAYPVGRAMLARQTPEGIGGTHGTITASRRSRHLTHDGLGSGQGDGRHGLGPGLWLHRGGR